MDCLFGSSSMIQFFRFPRKSSNSMARMDIIRDLELYLNGRVRNNGTTYGFVSNCLSTPNDIHFASFSMGGLLSICPCLIGDEYSGVTIRIRIKKDGEDGEIRRVCTTVRESIDFMEDVFLTHMDFCGQYLLPMEQEVPYIPYSFDMRPEEHQPSGIGNFGFSMVPEQGVPLPAP